MDDKNLEIEVEETEDGYVPRNAVVAAKERLYDKANLTIAQVDKFIIGCVAIILVLVIFGITH